ncbi:MAG: hypothetical protein HKO57_10090, partial [Akkermansiaceae bacterium]|nr:hypothetical protein [Akkermansiaceae bacterium]
MSKGEGNQSKWQGRARKVAGKVNLAWWLEKLGVPLLITALVASCLILLARRELEQFPVAEAVITGGVLLLSMLGIAWLVARRHFESPDDAMVRIEASMKLRNSLTAARHGVTPWPEMPERIDDGTRWHWPRLLSPVLAAALFLAASVFLPVSAKSDPNAGPLDEPQAWKDIEADIETLSEEDTVQEQYLDELEERLEELRKQKEEEWFSHSSLEATDALQKAHGAEVENLERNLRNAERALNALQKHGPNMAEGARQRLLNEFENAVRGMENGAMKPNQALLEQLRELDPEALNNLNPEQMEQLRDAMKDAAGKCQQ